ncbi:hypothetical protein ACFLXU_00520 [Chloroflexota bacterium]
MSEEPTTIDYLVKHLQEEISVNVEVEENKSSDSKAPVKVRFIVKNTRDPNILPNIVFQDVNLVFGIPPDMNTINIPRLAPGESHTCEHRCRFSELLLIQYDIRGNISPESLFQFQSTQNVIPSGSSLSIRAYKKMIAELDIHKWVKIIPEVTLMPEPDTTLSQLKEQENRLSALIAEARNAEQKVHDFSRFQDMSLGNRKREAIIQHRNMIMSYLKEVGQGIGELRRFYSSKPESRMIEATSSRLVSKLSSLLQKIDEAMEQLVD